MGHRLLAPRGDGIILVPHKRLYRTDLHAEITIETASGFMNIVLHMTLLLRILYNRQIQRLVWARIRAHGTPDADTPIHREIASTEIIRHWKFFFRVTERLLLAPKMLPCDAHAC